MEVKVRLFAGLKDIVGARDLCLDVADGATVHDVTDRLARDYPAVRPLIATLAFAVNDEFVHAGETLKDGAEVALIPPVSGGADDDDLYRLTRDPLESIAAQLAERVRSDDSGAVALFYGVVRNNSEDRDVERLEYEAHETMVPKQLREVADETKHRFPAIVEVGIWHRIGTLEIGEASLLVAVASPHRAEAFDACHWCVDRVKQVVPIWKKEHWATGAAWVEGHPVEPPEPASP